MSTYDGFNDEVLDKLPPGMRKRLENKTFYNDETNSERRICYSPLTGKSIRM